jgi:hypothetical protein
MLIWITPLHGMRIWTIPDDAQTRSEGFAMAFGAVLGTAGLGLASRTGDFLHSNSTAWEVGLPTCARLSVVEKRPEFRFWRIC